MISKKELKSAATVDSGKIKHQIGPENGFEIKSDAEGRSFVEGYIATKDFYDIQGELYDEEALTEDALEGLAEQINESTEEVEGEVTFPSPPMPDELLGNIEHQDTELMQQMIPEIADTSTVPALYFEEAEYDGYGTKVKAPIREDSLPEDTVEAIKQNIEEGVLSAFSVEFKDADDKLVRDGDKLKRRINDVNMTGAGLTAAPKNPDATLTDAELRSAMTDNETTITKIKKQIKTEVKNELKAEEYEYDTGDWVSRDWQGGNVYGKIRDRSKDQFTVEGNTITGDEEEPVYKMEQYDEEQEEFTGQMIAVPQSGLKSWQGAPENKALEDVDLTPPERVVNAAQAALDAKEEYADQIGDCGTGVGEMRAEQIVNNDLEPSDFLGGENTAYPDYLDSHEDDLSAEGPPTDWEEEEWTDGCGNIQYALWGFYKDWAMGVEQDLQDAKEQMEENKADGMMAEVDMIPMPDDAQLLYPSQGQAEAAAENLGMGQTSHSHQFEGETWYMPGEDHETFVDTMNELKERIGMKSYHTEEEMKAGVAGVEFTDTMEGELDESEIPNEGYEPHYLFPADTKSESTYPVVDADGNLRRGNVDAAHQLGARGGVDADELDRKLRALNMEFEDPPIEAFMNGEDKNMHDTMSEEPETGGNGSEESEEEVKSDLRESVEELKSTMSELKSTNEELREENEELKSEIEDYQEFEEIKSDLDGLEEELKSITSSDQPHTDTGEQKHESEQDDVPGELKHASGEFIKSHSEQLADKHNMTEEEVKNYV